MYGYIIPDKMNMFMKDYYRYRAFYCGLCKCIGHVQGEAMRFTTNYDMTFVSLFLHGYLGIEPEFRNEGCILNPIKKKTIARSTELMTAIAKINAMLMHYKLVDDKLDGGKRAVNSLFVNKHYKRACLEYAELDKIYNESYSRIFELEQNKCGSVDMIADPFGDMMRESIKTLLKEDYTDNVGSLFYNLGKFVYITDAIDDIGDDFKDGNYNPFLIDYDFKDRATFNAERGKELREILLGVYERIKECYKEIEMKTNEGVVTNILWYGTLERINAVLSATEKLKLPKV